MPRIAAALSVWILCINFLTQSPAWRHAGNVASMPIRLFVSCYFKRIVQPHARRPVHQLVELRRYRKPGYLYCVTACRRRHRHRCSRNCGYGTAKKPYRFECGGMGQAKGNVTAGRNSLLHRGCKRRVATLHRGAIFARPRRYSRTNCNQRDTNDGETATWTENSRVGGRRIWEFSVEHTENRRKHAGAISNGHRMHAVPTSMRR